MNRSRSLLNSMSPYAALVAVVAAIAFPVLKLGSYDLNIPFGYDGDSLVLLMYVKGLLLNGWNFTIPQLSAPFGLNAAAFPLMTNADWLIMKAVSLFTSEPGMVLNVFWLLTLVLSAATSAFALRQLGTGGAYAFAAGVAYAFLPFALMRNVSHLNLVYYLVPLLGALAVHIATGLANENDRAIRGVGYLACAAQGFDYIYYSFFAVLVFSFAALLAYVNTRARRALGVAATAIGLVVGATALNLSPSLYSWYSAGKPPEMNYKVPAEAETYAAKIRKMIAPHPRNPVPFLAEWGRQDQANGYPGENENISARLGLAASIGFILLLLASLRVIRLPQGAAGAVLGSLASLSLFTLLFITVGGLGAVFNQFFWSDIRAYNRFSVFLAFFALAGLGVALRAWLPRGRLRSRVAQPVIAALFLLGLYDQLLECTLPAQAQKNAQQYRADRELARRLGELYPAGAAVLQLPLTGFPPIYLTGRMVSYEHLRPFLWSDSTMRWSWPSFSLRHRAWQDRMASTDPAAMAAAAVYSDFNAILVDRHGYSDDANGLLAAFEAAGAVRQYAHPRYAVLDLARVKRQLLSKLGEAQYARKRQEWLEPVRFEWGPGFYVLEKTPAGETFRWSSNRSSLSVFNDSRSPKKIRLDFDVDTQAVGTVHVDSGTRRWQIDAPGSRRHAAIELDLAPAAKSTLSFRADVARVVAPGDPRALYFELQNFAYTELATDARADAVVAEKRDPQR